MRSFMLSTLALAALALPAAAQERVCREPSQADLAADSGFFSRENLDKFNDRTRYRPGEIFRFAALAGEHAFHNSFIEKCKPGEILVLKERVTWTQTSTDQLQMYRQFFLRKVERYCDFTRPINQFGENVICFAQVPPRD